MWTPAPRSDSTTASGELALAVFLLAAGTALLGMVRMRTRILTNRNRWLQAKVDEATRELQESHHSLQALTERLYRLNEEKSVFLGMAAHDLRNPLHGILLKAELLTLSEDSKAHLVASDICQAVDSVVNMLDRLLDMEAIESGHRSFHLEPVKASLVVQQGSIRHETRAKLKGIQILETLDDPGVQVRADLDTLNELMDNLISNALKFSHSGSRIGIGCGVEAGQGCVWVRDEGPGFHPDDMEEAFGRFAKLSARPTGGESSTGLGLSIVKRLTEDMGGRVQLESEPGAGATFKLLLPLAQDPESSAQ